TSQIVDSCVAAEYQRSLKREGAFLRVATLYFDTFAYGHPTVLCYGYPVPNAQRLGVRFLGYIPVLTPVKQLTCTVDASHLEGLEKKGQGVEIEKVTHFTEEVDAFWESMKPDIGYTLVRNSKFFNWRFFGHPRVDYHCVQARRNGELAGLLAYRVGWIDEKITPLVELFTRPDDHAAQAALTAQAARHGLEAGCPRLEMWLPPNGTWFQAFPGFGFEVEGTRFNMINRLFADWMNEEWLMENYFFTMGDSDIY
ncbi:MAG: hypothetical protein KJ645_07900, partial [Planctomycetes bacterium]|nr:hypothetical protein [Planctomycetota bacterium]